MFLFIDASDQNQVRLALTSDKKIARHTFTTSHNLSEKLIPEIEKFFKKQKVKFDQIKKIEVMPGPGFFSRIRSSVATANALAFALNLKQKMVRPIYDKLPNISKPKKKRFT